MRFPSVRGWLGSILLPLLVLFGSVTSDAAENLEVNRRELQQLQESIRQAATRLQGREEAERSLAAEMRSVDEAQRQLGNRIESLNRRLTTLDLELTQTNREHQELSAQVDQLEQRVRLRLGVLYRQGNVSPLRFLLAGDSPQRLAQDAEFMERIVRRDRKLLQDFQDVLARQQESLQRLAELRHDEGQLLEQREREREVLAEAVELKSTMLGQVRQERTALASQLAELQQRATELAALIKRLESAKSASYSQKNRIFPEQKGHLPWPAEGVVRIGFGTSRHPELGTLYQSQGVELKVKPQQQVAAVWPGKVVFADYFKGYGQLLILEHGGGYFTLYAQMARLVRRVGDTVEQGDQLAMPGGERNDRLYFEIRKGGVPLDPREWLVPR